VKYDEHDRAIWIRVSKNSVKKDDFKSLDLKTPTDRRGKIISDGKISHQLESLSYQYREAVEEACMEVKRHLEALRISLLPCLESLILSAYSSIMARALVDHVDEAKRRGWCLPLMQEIDGYTEVENGQDAAAEEMKGCPRMEIQGMWPYWKEKHEAVKNDLVLSRTILLTGPNMAGKSTVLRSVAAIALLGACGLAVPGEREILVHTKPIFDSLTSSILSSPAERAPSVPFYDSFMLRNYSGDSPLENLSSFALEMADVKVYISYYFYLVSLSF
jgi:MutS domain V